MNQLKSWEAKAAEVMPHLPENLKPIAAQGASIVSQLEQFKKEQPEFYKTVESMIVEADKPGIRATVTEARDPSTIKYTEEGTMVHDLMQSVAKTERRMQHISGLEYKLSASDKSLLTEMTAALAAEKGMESSDVNVPIPETVKLP